MRYCDTTLISVPSGAPKHKQYTFRLRLSLFISTATIGFAIVIVSELLSAFPSVAPVFARAGFPTHPRNPELTFWLMPPPFVRLVFLLVGFSTLSGLPACPFFVFSFFLLFLHWLHILFLTSPYIPNSYQFLTAGVLFGSRRSRRFFRLTECWAPCFYFCICYSSIN